MISTNWGSATDVGLVRRHNEDALLAQFPLFLVADGMGGHAAGEVASSLTSERFRQLAVSEPLTASLVAEAIDEANRTVLDAARAADRLDGMGTTLVGLARVHDRSQELWLVFNVGDSRLYRWFDGVMRQVTTDHSEVQELIDQGAITDEGARAHPLRNIITRAIGTEDRVEADFWLLPPVPGERFLLCSDGLTGEVPDATIAAVLSRETDPSVAATRLVEQAVSAGGRDNVTVVVVDVVDVVEGDTDDTDDTARGREVLLPERSVAPVPDDGLTPLPTEGSFLISDVPHARREPIEQAMASVIHDVPPLAHAEPAIATRYDSGDVSADTSAGG